MRVVEPILYLLTIGMIMAVLSFLGSLRAHIFAVTAFEATIVGACGRGARGRGSGILDSHGAARYRRGRSGHGTGASHYLWPAPNAAARYAKQQAPGRHEIRLGGQYAIDSWLTVYSAALLLFACR